MILIPDRNVRVFNIPILHQLGHLIDTTVGPVGAIDGNYSVACALAATRRSLWDLESSQMLCGEKRDEHLVPALVRRWARFVERFGYRLNWASLDVDSNMACLVLLRRHWRYCIVKSNSRARKFCGAFQTSDVP
jgi:hypothetical protein